MHKVILFYLSVHEYIFSMHKSKDSQCTNIFSQCTKVKIRSARIYFLNAQK